MQTLEEKDARIEAQAEKIKELKDENQLLMDEKHDLTMCLNDVSKELDTQKTINQQQRLKLHQVHANYTRSDANWDSRPREVSE
ncbi:hypothetical protein [Salinicoccus sp. HZC-1]|uniref:hypothetical protein n=1 Tax=Salinicoccus sp. HZC-1 TaxID=3385497 RepID=UPI00398B65C5